MWLPGLIRALQRQVWRRSISSAEIVAETPLHGAWRCTNRSYILVSAEELMAKNTSISLGDHFESFIDRQIESGRYGSVSEVIRASLRLLEEHEQKINALRQALIEGENSGDAGELNMAAGKRKARIKAKAD